MNKYPILIDGEKQQVATLVAAIAALQNLAENTNIKSWHKTFLTAQQQLMAVLGEKEDCLKDDSTFKQLLREIFSTGVVFGYGEKYGEVEKRCEVLIENKAQIPE